jgi:hypothetical protein
MRSRVPRLTLWLIIGAIASPAAQHLEPGSVERVRAALAKPPSRLTLTARKPDFAVEIHERRPLQEIFDAPPWATPPPGWSPPGGWRPAAATAFGTIPILSVDLLAIGGAIERRVNDARRSHAVADASEEVSLAIASYCAARPNGGADIQICRTSPAIR